MKITFLMSTFGIFLCNDVFDITLSECHEINIQFSVKDFHSNVRINYAL